MATSAFVQYTGDGETSVFPITFAYLDAAHIKAELGTLPESITVINGGASVQFSVAPAIGTTLTIFRETPKVPLIDFNENSILKEADLDLSLRQSIYVAEESFASNIIAIRKAEEIRDLVEADRLEVVGREEHVIEMEANVTTQESNVVTRHVDIIERQADVIDRQADVTTKQVDVTSRQLDVTARQAAVLITQGEIDTTVAAEKVNINNLGNVREAAITLLANARVKGIDDLGIARELSLNNLGQFWETDVADTGAARLLSLNNTGSAWEAAVIQEGTDRALTLTTTGSAWEATVAKEGADQLVAIDLLGQEWKTDVTDTGTARELALNILGGVREAGVVDVGEARETSLTTLYTGYRDTLNTIDSTAAGRQADIAARQLNVQELEVDTQSALTAAKAAQALAEVAQASSESTLAETEAQRAIAQGAAGTASTKALEAASSAASALDHRDSSLGYRNEAAQFAEAATSGIVFFGVRAVSAGDPPTPTSNGFYRMTGTGIVAGVSIKEGDELFYDLAGATWQKIGRDLISIADVTSLQTALDGKSATSHAHDTDYLGITATASNATKLATPRTISLTGDVTGSVSFDGSANAAITAVVGNDTHTHTWANIVTKPTTFPPSAHTQAWSTITGTPATYAPTAHTQAWSTITGTPTSYTPSAHAHDWTSITSKPTTFAPATHAHDWASITSKPTTFAPASHTHSYTALTSIPTSFAPAAHTQAWSTITGTPTSFTPSAHNQAWSTITGTPATYPPSSHTHDYLGSTSKAADSSKLNGIVNTTASTGNTIVQRDASGDMAARLFKSEYDSNNTTVNHIMTQVDTVSNNYIRPTTPASFRASVTDAYYTKVPTGTRMIFQQTSAPTGWVKDTATALNNKALRIVTGTASSGGTALFTAAFNTDLTTSSSGKHTPTVTTATGGAHTHTVTVNNTTLTAAHMPSHRHSVTAWKDYMNRSTAAFGGSRASTSYGSWVDNTMATTGGSTGHNHGGSTASAGGHTHTMTGTEVAAHSHTVKPDVAYYDVIVARKS